MDDLTSLIARVEAATGPALALVRAVLEGVEGKGAP